MRQGNVLKKNKKLSNVFKVPQSLTIPKRKLLRLVSNNTFSTKVGMHNDYIKIRFIINYYSLLIYT